MTKRAVGVMQRMMKWLSGQSGVRFSMTFAGAMLLLGASFVLLTVYFAAEERAVARAQAEAAESVVLEASGNLSETAEHLYRLQERLQTHLDGAAPFRLIEEHLDAEVGFSSVMVDYVRPEIRFSVHAPNAGAIARQVAAFENDMRITHVEVSPLERDRDSQRYEAEMVIVLDSDVLLAFPNLSDS